MIDDAVLTGGCQCGAGRYALGGDPTSVEVCYCRMCQKALGNVFAPFASVRVAQFAWTRGEPAVFQSSSVAERGFCAACGTPLFFHWLGSDHISVTIGSLDQPATIAPRLQYGIESRLPWLDRLADLPGTRTEDDQPPERRAAFESYQHPDREVKDR
jgi:hypothetical protein